jgi:hypothetical protein
MGECTCGSCPNCSHMEEQGCMVCEDGPEPGRILNLHCSVHGLTSFVPEKEDSE